jgi:hypothetical protein
MLMCIPDPDESKIVTNITQSIGFQTLKKWLSQVKKRKISHSMAYTSIKVREIILFRCSFEESVF